MIWTLRTALQQTWLNVLVKIKVVVVGTIGVNHVLVSLLVRGREAKQVEAIKGVTAIVVISLDDLLLLLKLLRNP